MYEIYEFNEANLMKRRNSNLVHYTGMEDEWKLYFFAKHKSFSVSTSRET